MLLAHAPMLCEAVRIPSTSCHIRAMTAGAPSSVKDSRSHSNMWFVPMGTAQGVCTRTHFVLWQGDMYLATTGKGRDISNLLAGQGFEGGLGAKRQMWDDVGKALLERFWNASSTYNQCSKVLSCLLIFASPCDDQKHMRHKLCKYLKQNWVLHVGVFWSTCSLNFRVPNVINTDNIRMQSLYPSMCLAPKWDSGKCSSHSLQRPRKSQLRRIHMAVGSLQGQSTRPPAFESLKLGVSI